MRRIVLLLATLSLTLSCQSKENPTPEKVVLSISPEAIDAEAAGGVFTVNAVCGEKPYIVGQSNWCEVTASSVRNNACELTVNVSANDTYEPRSVQFSVVCADMKKYLKVNQAAAQEDLSFLDTPALPDNNAISLSRKLGYGWNLGNQMLSLIHI